MTKNEAELIIESHQKALFTELSLPCSKGRIRMAYLTYISGAIAADEEFIKHSIDDLVQGYINLDPYFKEQPLSRFNEIAEFITECKKYRAESAALPQTAVV